MMHDIDQLTDEDEYPICDSFMISSCCGAKALGEFDSVPDNCPVTGICSCCRDHASFEKECE